MSLKRDSSNSTEVCNLCQEDHLSKWATNTFKTTRPSLTKDWLRFIELEEVTYLLVVDFKIPWTQALLEPSSLLSIIFSRYGIPEVLISDNGPQYIFLQEMKDFNMSILVFIFHKAMVKLNAQSKQTIILKTIIWLS